MEIKEPDLLSSEWVQKVLSFTLLLALMEEKEQIDSQVKICLVVQAKLKCSL